ncbi:MAG: hypothetical protein Q7S55_03015 [Nanoarchaeota archaeon]|nr:hypothetical protein [Nanoarchaeota archaeon]
MKKEVYRVRIALVFILIILITLPLFSNAAPPPRVCGDGQCQEPETCSDCSADCGVCPEEPTTAGGGGPTPVTVSIEAPEDGETLKRGILTILVKGYRGTNPESDMVVTAISDLFGELTLVNDFEQRGSGIYGANVTISKDVKEGDYVILVRGRRGSAVDEHQILVTLDPTITVESAIKESYFKGDRIFFEGVLKYFDGSLAKNSSLEIAFFGPVDYFFNMTTASDQNGKFAVSYPISFAEPEGNWDVRITAKDKDGNEGFIILKTKVLIPEGVVFYTVNFLSPFKDAEFKRGSTVPITVEVKDEGNLVEKAKVEFKNPHGEFIPLAEVRPGTYSLEYHPPPYDSLGVWQILVQALKTVDGVTKAGGNRIAVTVLPETLHLVLLQPTTFDFFTGQQIPFKTKLTYADGIAVENAKIQIKIGNETITLSETEPGIYEEQYLFSSKDMTANGLELYAEDVHGNSVAVPKKAIVIEQISKPELLVRLFYYRVVARYWYLFVVGIIILIIGTEPGWHPKYLQKRLKNLSNAERINIETQKDIQRKYFKHHSINRDSYEKLILKYRENISALKERKLEVQEKLGKKRFGWRRISGGKKRS